MPDGVETDTELDLVDVDRVDEALTEALTEALPDLLDVEELTTLLLEASEVSLYISSLFPAPQYS